MNVNTDGHGQFLFGRRVNKVMRIGIVNSTIEFDPRNRISLKFSAPEVEFSTPEAEVKIGNSEYAAEYNQV